MQPASRPPPEPPRRWPTVLALAVTVVAVTALGAMLLRGRPVQIVYDRWLFHTVPQALFTGWLGWALVRRPADRWLGHLFLFVGVMSALHAGTTAVADTLLVAAGIDSVVRFVPAELPVPAAVVLWFSLWLWLPGVVLFPLMLLRFPDGRWPGRRWRAVMPVFGLGLAAVIAGYAVGAWPWSRHLTRIYGAHLATDVSLAVAATGSVLVFGGMMAALASFGLRWRRAQGEERRQLRVVGTSLALLALSVLLLWPWLAVWAFAQVITGGIFFAAYTLAVLRYRLHDLDVAINRTVVAAVLTLLVTGTYLAVVVGLGSAIGRRADHPLLPLLAVGLVAVLFEPVRRRVRRFVDRLLYGRDADAHEVLSELATQLRDAGSTDAVTGHVCDLLVRGTGATGAEITIDDAGESRLLAAAGGRGSAEPALTAPIVHNGERLGTVALYARSASVLAPDAPELLRDVAGMLGAVLRNAMLTAQLQAQVAELQQSRQRLVTAHDEARRELERDIHDGAQVRLVALRLQLSVAAQQAAALADGVDSGELEQTLGRLGHGVDAVIRSLRDLSRGLHPPILESDGVAAALRASVRGLPVGVALDAAGVERFDPRAEAAVYFCCLEAIKNAATHAGARQVRVVLANGDGKIRFSVEDDGRGFDPATVQPGRGLSNLDDRVAGLGGRLVVDAAPGRGSRIVGEVPVQPVVSDR